MYKYFITGGGGFIGYHLVKYLISRNKKVIIYDNFSIKYNRYIDNIKNNKNLKIIKGDILNINLLTKSMKNTKFVFHLAANSDVKNSSNNPDIDFKNGVIGTFNVLKAMKKNKIRNLCFTSSSVVYGIQKRFPLKEDIGALFPISMYGSSKLAAEAIISSFSNNFKIKTWIFRFANVIGLGLTHGVIYDLTNKLKKNKKNLKVLGNGNQTKPYIYIDDLIDAIFFSINNSKDEFNYFNISSKGSTQVKFIVKELLKKLNLKKTKIIYQKKKQGWIGDVTKIALSNQKLLNLGWKPKIPRSNQVVTKVISELLNDKNLI